MGVNKGSNTPPSRAVLEADKCSSIQSVADADMSQAKTAGCPKFFLVSCWIGLEKRSTEIKQGIVMWHGHTDSHKHCSSRPSLFSIFFVISHPLEGNFLRISPGIKSPDPKATQSPVNLDKKGPRSGLLLVWHKWALMKRR